MNWMNSPGKGDMTESTARGVISFITPAKANSTASTPWTIHSARFRSLHALLSTLPFHCGFVK